MMSTTVPPPSSSSPAVVIFDLDETILHTVLFRDMTASTRALLTEAVAAPPEEGYQSQPSSATPKLSFSNPGGGRRTRSLGPEWGYKTDYHIDRRAGRGVLSVDDEIIYGGSYVSYVRPGMLHALRRLAASKKCTLCLCTFGERSYVCDLVAALDPDGSIFGDRVLDRSSFTLGVKVVPKEWGGAAAAVAIDDQVSVWEEQVLVARIDPYCACAPAPKHGTTDRASAEAYTALLLDALEQCIAAWQSVVSRKKLAKGFARYVANHWPLGSVIRMEPVAPPPPPSPLLLLSKGCADEKIKEQEEEEESMRLTSLLFCYDSSPSPLCIDDDDDEDEQQCEPIITLDYNNKYASTTRRHRLPALEIMACADA